MKFLPFFSRFIVWNSRGKIEKVEKLLQTFLEGFQLYTEWAIFAILLAKTQIWSFMLIIDVKDNESIERALKKYKRKFDRAGIMKELRSRKHFVKPSIKRRGEIQKAVYKQKTYGEQG